MRQCGPHSGLEQQTKKNFCNKVGYILVAKENTSRPNVIINCIKLQRAVNCDLISRGVNLD